MNLFVGNLSWDADEQSIRSFFEGFGPIKSVKIITDRETGKPRGFAFVEYENSADGDKAIRGTNGREFMGRDLTVNQAKPREQGGGGGGGGNRGPGGGGRDRGRSYDR